jgi:raffinose/stachyose/melibiose transport system substrate-binding protein
MKRFIARTPLRQRSWVAGGIAAVVASAMLMSACGFVNNEEEPNPSGTVGGTLRMYVNTEQSTGLEPLYSAFEQTTGATVDLRSAATAELNEQLAVQLSSGTAADIFRVSPGFSSPVAVGVLGADGQLADLSAAPWVSSMGDSMKTLATADGKISAFPLGQNALVVAYNKAVFADAGVEVPTTWSELIAACQTLQAAGVVPISAGFTGGIFLQFWAYALAATLVYGPDPQANDKMLAGTTNFADSAAWTTVFEKFLELKPYMTEGANGVSSEQSTADVATGKAAMQLMASAGLPALFNASPGGADDFSIFALPATDDAADTRLPIAPDFLAVNANASNRATADAFLEFLAQPKNVKAYAESLGVLPGLEVPVEITVAPLVPIMSYIEDGLTTPFANYLWPNGSTQQRLLATGQQLLAGEVDIPELLSQLDAEFDKGTQ